jgi:outer membrane protein TolC
MNLTHTNERSRNTEDQRRQIAQRAYELYEQRGRQNGFAMQDWLQAEQELTRAAEGRPAEKFFVSKAI